MNIELSAIQLLALGSLAIACGVCFGIAIGLHVYSRYGRNR